MYGLGAGMKKGDVMGHEFMGIVEDVGPEVKGLKKGDRVVSAFDMGCSRCFFCKKVCTHVLFPAFRVSRVTCCTA